MTQCEVKGLGTLPCKFTAEFDNLNLENTRTANGHHEGRIKMICKSEPWYAIDDDIVITGEAKKNGDYKVSVDFDSEVRVGLFRGGRIDFTYNSATKRWSMRAWRTNESPEREWAFCDPYGVIDIALRSMSCYSRSETGKADGYDAAIQVLLKDIMNQKAQIAKSSLFYTERSDCTAKYKAPKRVQPGDSGSAITWD